MKNEILIALGAIAAVVVGWALNEVSSIRRSRKDTKAKLNAALFNLIDLYYEFGWTNINGLMDIYIGKIKHRFPGSFDSPEEARQFKNAINPFLKDIAHKMDASHVSELKSRYQTAVADLASVDPFQAFFLSSKNRLLDIFDQIASWLDDVKAIPIPDGEAQLCDNFFEFVQKETRDQALKSLENEIKSIAFKIGPISWFKSIRCIKRIEQRRTKEIEAEMDKYLEPLFTQITQGLNGQGVSSKIIS